MTSLSSLVVQRQVATMRDVEEALARQVIHGGDLATNLLEVARIDEGLLTQLIAESTGLAPAPAGELPLLPEHARMVPRDMAIARGIVPLKFEGEILVVAVAEPIAADIEERLMFALGIPLEQCAALSVRVRQAISRLYEVPLEHRMERLLARLSGLPTPLPARVESRTPAFGTAAAGVAAQADTGRVPRLVLQGASPAGSPAPRTPARHHTSDGFPGPVHAGLLRRDVPLGARTARRRRGPITWDVATGEAEEMSESDALLDLFFDFSRQYFDYTALFLVHGDIAEGRDSFGLGAGPERVVGIGVPLDLPSLLSSAKNDRAARIAVPPAEGLEVALLLDLQRPRDAEVAIVPLVVRTRTVALLLGDCGNAGIDRADVQHVTTFSSIVGKALERLIVQRKLHQRIASSAAQGAPGSQAAPGSTGPERAAEAPDRQTLPSMKPAVAQPAAAPLLATSNLPPPPPNVVVVRPISGPPIPREEPESPARPLEIASAEVSRLDGAASLEVKADGPEVDVTLEPALPADMDSRALFGLLGWETGAEEPERPPPSSSLAVPPHRPPRGHHVRSPELPAVIVDLELELATMVEKVLTEEVDEGAEGELLRQGERAMPAVMARFPGPVTFERSRIASMANPPRASDCGPIMRLVARQRKVSLPFVLRRTSDADPETRGWATHLLAELPYEAAIPQLVARLRDSDPATCVSAALALGAVAKLSPGPVHEAIRTLVRSSDPEDRLAALGAMIHLRQAALVPEVVQALADADERVVAAAHAALIQVTRSDLGKDAGPWVRWWQENGSRHRIEWLIDALTHDVSEIRRSAGEELRVITREYFGYASDLPPRDRDRAQQRYRDWWITDGQMRFRRR